MDFPIYAETTIQEIVVIHPQTRLFFENIGIDYIYRGDKTIGAVASEINIDKQKLIGKLNDIRKVAGRENTHFLTWPLDLLIDYIQKKHHRYIITEIAVIQFYLEKVCRVHGERHSELFEIKSIFKKSSTELLSEIEREQSKVFSVILKLFEAKKDDRLHDLPSNTELIPMIEDIQMFQLEQRDMHFQIETLSKGYINPKDGCTSYRIGMEKLRTFKDDLDTQAHLKNNILFPQALILEQYFRGQEKYEFSK